MSRRSAIAGALLATVVVALLLPRAHSAPASSLQQGAPTIELVEQTAVAPPGGTYAVRFRTPGVPDDGTLRVVIHQRVRSRSELAQSMEGSGLRTEVLVEVHPLDGLPPDGNGARRWATTLAPAAGGIALGPEGVYPVELEARDAGGTAIASLVTHLVLGPAEGDESPSLGVAVLTELGLPTALQPDGTVVLERSAVGGLVATAQGLASAPDVPATALLVPETLEALGASTVPEDATVVDGIRAATEGHAVVTPSYVVVDPDALEAAGLTDELANQQRGAAAAVSTHLGVEPAVTLASASPTLGAGGMRALAEVGVTGIVVADTQLEPLEPATIPYSLAQPVQVEPPVDTPTEQSTRLPALVTDHVLLERLATPGTPGLVASRVLTELAFIRLEQPSLTRAMVVPLPTGTPADVVRLVLQGLGGGRPFAPITLGDAFTFAEPLVDPGDNPVVQHLLPSPAPAVRDDDTEALRQARADLQTYAGIVADDPSLTGPLSRHLLVASASDLTREQRRAHVDQVATTTGAVADGVSMPSAFTLTLTARDGTIPLTIDNTTGLPVHATIHLRSQKLDFPDGDTIPVVLTEATQRVDIQVRALASGAFPLEIEVTSPDARSTLAASRYTIRSTAVSGAGLVLSIGAGTFLVVWWARHWHRTRRSAKLVAADADPSANPSEDLTEN